MFTRRSRSSQKRLEVSIYYPYLNLVPRSYRATETAWPWNVWVRDLCWIEADTCNTCKTVPILSCPDKFAKLAIT